MDRIAIEQRFMEPDLAFVQQEAKTALMDACSRFSPQEVAVLGEALGLALDAHRGQYRQSGEPYVTHPVEVAGMAAQMGLDAEAIAAALLHDVVEDTSVGLLDIEKRFGKTISGMVDALTKIDALKFEGVESKEQAAKAETLRKMMLAMSKDVRVVFVKLCDRIHNLRTIAALGPAKRVRMAEETVAIYAPIASRLGMNAMWSELMQLSFFAKHPWRARVLAKELERSHSHHRNYMDAAASKLLALLDQEGLSCEVSGRRKSAHSVYAKMKEKKLRFSEVHDVEGLRVIVSSKNQCYQALGVFHECWKPMPGYFKDYIAIPKINGYQSLHTAVVNDLGHTMEIQVRTKAMHDRAEFGIASHWAYKDKKDNPAGGQESWRWLQSLLDIQASSGHAADYLEHVKTDLFSDEVYVFTPKGEVVAIQRGACALDYAFAVHSDIGLRASSASINGERCELSTKLRTGDVVSIEAGEAIAVKTHWLAFAKTGKAKSHIRARLRMMQADWLVTMGEELIAQEICRLGCDKSALNDLAAWAKCEKRFAKKREELCVQVGQGALSPLAVGKAIASVARRSGSAAALRPILITGEEFEGLKMADCCFPMPPQKIAGILSQEHGLMVHRCECSALAKAKKKGQAIDLAWEESALSSSFSASIKVKSKNQRGALGRLAALIASLDGDVNNVRISGNAVGEERATIDFDLQVRSKFHLDRIVEALSKDDSVLGVF